MVPMRGHNIGFGCEINKIISQKPILYLKIKGIFGSATIYVHVFHTTLEKEILSLVYATPCTELGLSIVG